MRNIRTIMNEYHLFRRNVEKSICEIIKERVDKYDSSIVVSASHEPNRICVKYKGFTFLFSFTFGSTLYLRGNKTIRNSRQLPKDVEKEKTKAYNYVKSIIRQCLEEDM